MRNLVATNFLTRSSMPAKSRIGYPAPSAHAFPRSVQVLFAVLFGLALFRVTALAFNGTDLFTDEAQYWSWSREPAFGYYSKPPLIAWIIAATTPVCGDSEFCVRLPSVFFHLATSLVIYVIGLRLFSERVGFWSAVTFATLPGISASSGIISTDVPLLFAWAVALLAFAELVVVPSYAMAILLGAALGFGLNAKYAMAYFVPCAALFFVLVPERSAILRQKYLWIAAAIARAPHRTKPPLERRPQLRHLLAHGRQCQLDRFTVPPRQGPRVPGRTVRCLRPHHVRRTTRHFLARLALVEILARQLIAC